MRRVARKGFCRSSLLQHCEVGELVQVSRRHPSALLDEPLSILVDLRSRLRDLIHSHLVPPSSTLDIAERLVQALQLNLNLALGILGIFNSNLLESFNRANLLVNVVCLGLKGLEVLLDLVDHSSVLEDGAVIAEVDAGGLVLENRQAAAGLVISLLEVVQGAGRAAAQR